MKKMHLAFLVVLALAFPTLSLAGDITMSLGGNNCGGDGVCSVLQGQPGSTTVNFNDPFTYPVSPTYTLTGTATLATGTISFMHLAPAGDTSQYITTKTGTIDITNLPGGDTYFGLYIGSLDKFNSLTFTDSLGNKTTITGAMIGAMFGLQTNGTQSAYINFTVNTPGVFIDEILMASTLNGFETDNDTFFSPGMPQNPEPATLSVLGVGLFALGAGLRRKMAGV